MVNIKSDQLNDPIYFLYDDVVMRENLNLLIERVLVHLCEYEIRLLWLVQNIHIIVMNIKHMM